MREERHRRVFVELQCGGQMLGDLIDVLTMSSIFKIDRTVSVARRIALTETSNG